MPLTVGDADKIARVAKALVGDDDTPQESIAAPVDRSHEKQASLRYESNDQKIVAELNREFALALVGKSAVILRETPNAPIEDRVRILTVDAFGQYLANRWTSESYAGRGGETMTRRVLYSKLWMSSRERRTYDGVEFFPDSKNLPGTPGYFNLWRGFAVTSTDQPASDRWLKYKTFRDHLLQNVCGGNPVLFKWLFAWFAHIVQKPRERIGTAIVLRGGEGSGKTKIGEIIGSLFPSHYFLVDDPRYLTGQFNAHMASCLLLQVDEGFWAGDKAAEGRLKGLITAPKQMIEAKGIDPIRLDNFVRLLFSSNERWVVPVGLDGRRFVVLDVSNRVARNTVYFGEMDAEMANGGREALLADLLEFDLSQVDLRDVPKTTALLEQKIRSLDPVQSWWFDRLSSGSLTRRQVDWSTDWVAKEALFNDYIYASEKIGIRRKSAQTEWGIAMRDLLTDTEGVRHLEVGKHTVECDHQDGSTMIRRVPTYRFPPLDVCRSIIESKFGQDVVWEMLENKD